MPETKRILWVDEQAGELLRDFKACVEKQRVNQKVGLSFDFTLTNNIEDGASLVSQPFDALILEIVLPRDVVGTVKLEGIRLRREEIKDQLGRERICDLLSGNISPTILEENLLSRFRYLGTSRDEYWEVFGGFEILKRWKKDSPVIILTTQSLKDKEMAKQFSLLGLTKSRWFVKPRDLKKVAKTLVGFLQKPAPAV
jgi:hypothetical protein